VAVAVSLGSVLLASAPASAQEPNLRVELESITPYVNSSTRNVRVTGRVVNTGDVPLWTVNAMLWVDDEPLTTRRQLAQAAAEEPGERLGNRYDEPWELVDEVATTLAPRQAAKFSVNVPIDQLTFGAKGIYVAGVDVRATPPESDIRETWRARSFLPYLPKGTKMTPVEVSFLLPMTARPSLVAGDVLTASTSGNATTTASGLPNPGEFGPNGRLTRLLELGSAHDLTFVVDPELLAEAERMANGYTTSTGERISAEDAAQVRRWLNRARGILGASHTLMLPYADPDLTALERHRLTDRYGRAVQSAEEAVKDYRASGTIAWPGTGFADAGTLETVAASGANTVLLSARALPRLPSDGSSPVASLATPDGALTALVADPTLTAGGPGGPNSQVSVQQRFLGETALLALRGGGSMAAQRRVVAALPRDWNPGTSGSVLFSTVESTPWLRPVRAGALMSQAPTAYGGPLAKSAANNRRALSPVVISHLRKLSTTTDTWLDMLAEPARSRATLDRGILRGMSMAWRHDPQRAVQLIDAMDADLQEQITKVSVVPPRLVTLSSRSGRFPVTIWNRGSEPVHVQLDVRSHDPDLLTVAPIEPVRIDPRRRTTVSVTADTTGGGAVQLDARLATPAGTEFGETETFNVRIRGYGQVGWAVIGVGLGLLLLASALRIIRRVRAAVVGRREAAQVAGTVSAAAALGDSAGAAEHAVDAGAATRNGTVESPVSLNGHLPLPTDLARPDASGSSSTPGDPTDDNSTKDNSRLDDSGRGDPPDATSGHDMTRAER
jgi:Family of unknown function (DUF6049)